MMAGAMLATIVGPATAHRRPGRSWKFEKRVRHSWTSHRGLQDRHSAWHDEHTVPVTREVTNEDGTTSQVTTEEPTYTEGEHDAYHHTLQHKHMRRFHKYRIASRQRGKASWYDYRGQTGACGKVLKGKYAAHRTLPCGAKVAVRRGGKVVTVRILDRGPFVSGWIIDLSPKAFRKLGGMGEGVIPIRLFHLKKRR
jgi:rare lipoprotein A